MTEYERRDFGLSTDVATMMAATMYDAWYRKDVSPNLTKQQKIDLLKRISELSLKRPFWLEDSIGFEDFPELKPHSHTGVLSGTQLYAVMTAIFAELCPNSKLAKPYPELPIKKPKSRR